MLYDPYLHSFYRPWRGLNNHKPGLQCLILACASLCSLCMAGVVSAHTDTAPGATGAPPLIDVFGVRMVNVEALADWTDGLVKSEIANGVVTIRKGGTRIEILTGSYIASVNGHSSRMPMHVVRRNGTAYVPMAWISDSLDIGITFDTVGLQPRDVFIVNLRTGARLESAFYGRGHAVVENPRPHAVLPALDDPMRAPGNARRRIPGGYPYASAPRRQRQTTTGELTVDNRMACAADVTIKGASRDYHLNIGTGAMRTIELPIGSYDVELQFAYEPGSVYEGDRVTVSAGRTTLILNSGSYGNYNVHRR